MFKVCSISQYKRHPNFWYMADPTCKTLYRFKFLYVIRQMRVPNSSCIFKMGTDKCNIRVAFECPHQSICETAVEQTNLLSSFRRRMVC